MMSYMSSAVKVMLEQRTEGDQRTTSSEILYPEGLILRLLVLDTVTMARLAANWLRLSHLCRSTKHRT